VPFLGTLYEFVTELPGDEEELMPINAVALMVAIPTVIVGKIETGSVPLVDNGHGLGSASLFNDLLGPPDRLPMPAAPAPSVPGGVTATSRVAMEAAPAASSPGANDRSAAEYSRWAGLAGVIAGWLVTLVNIATAGNGELGLLTLERLPRHARCGANVAGDRRISGGPSESRQTPRLDPDPWTRGR
jgi:hypothetical protein